MLTPYLCGSERGMTIGVKCSCGAKLQAPDDVLGKGGKCPHCGTASPIAPWLICSTCGADVTLDADARFACPCSDKNLQAGRHAFCGPPGVTWTNRTTRALYQFQASFH